MVKCEDHTLFLFVISFRYQNLFAETDFFNTEPLTE